MNDLIKFKRFDLRYLHIAIIILGSIFISLSAFHSNLWFDESYSVGIANHSFKDIWIIGGSVMFILSFIIADRKSVV